MNIIGGRPARQGEIPYILSLQLNGRHHCGASIIEINGTILAISAAHCTILDLDQYNVTVVAGELKLSDTTGTEQRVKVTEVINHEFNWITKENDISLLFLEKNFTFNDHVKAIALPPPGNTSSGKQIPWKIFD